MQILCFTCSLTEFQICSSVTMYTCMSNLPEGIITIGFLSVGLIVNFGKAMPKICHPVICMSIIITSKHAQRWDFFSFFFSPQFYA